MISKYIPAIEEVLQNKYPLKEQQMSVELSNIKFKMFLPKTTLLLASYKQIKNLSITHCDLRNLQNFPKLPSLQQLNLGFNQLQGTLNCIIPLKRLKYLNLQNNIVYESNKLAPLKKIVGNNHSFGIQRSAFKLAICIRNNPFLNKQSAYVNKLKGYGLKIVKEPKQYFDKKKSDQQKVQNLKNKNKNSAKKNHQKKKKNKTKRKKSELSEIDSFYSSQKPSQSSSSSSEFQDRNISNNNQNSSLASTLQRNRSGITNNNEPGANLIQRRITSNTFNNLDRLLSIHSNPFFDINQIQGNDANNFGSLPQIDSGNDALQNIFSLDRRIIIPQNQQSRIRSIGQRNSRFQQIRHTRQNRSQRQRRIPRQEIQRERRSELLHRRAIRQIQLIQRMNPQRDSSNSSSNGLLNGRMSTLYHLNHRLSESNNASNRSGNNSGIQDDLINSSNRLRGYRIYLQRVNNLERLRSSNNQIPMIHSARNDSEIRQWLNTDQEIVRESDNQQNIIVRISSSSVSDDIDDNDSDDNDNQNDEGPDNAMGNQGLQDLDQDEDQDQDELRIYSSMCENEDGGDIEDDIENDRFQLLEDNEDEDNDDNEGNEDKEGNENSRFARPAFNLEVISVENVDNQIQGHIEQILSQRNGILQSKVDQDSVNGPIVKQLNLSASEIL